MAANDFYQTPNRSDKRRSDAPLPPLPVPTSSFSAYKPGQASRLDSPVSPINDPSSPVYRDYSQQSLDSSTMYFGAGGGGKTTEQGPYADDIPLRSQKNSADELPRSEQPQRINGLPREGADRPRRSRQKKKKGLFSGRVPWVVYILTLVQLTVFIAELVKSSILTKSPIEIHPQVNPMLGPSPYVLINMGARYVPCMKNVHNVTDVAMPYLWPCPNSTTNDLTSPQNMCQLSDLCGFSAALNPRPNGTLNDSPRPNQWWRFIVPMFLHAGFIHIAFNLLLQLTLARDIEKTIGSVRFAIVYFSSGIFGFVLGGNFAAPGIASTGASGSLFGIIAIDLLDLLYGWGERKSPWVDLAWVVLDIVISFVLGLLPGLDNFSHIGGFLMGLVLGICTLHTPNALRRRVGTDEPPYKPVKGRSSLEQQPTSSFRDFRTQPVGFFKGRKEWWWAWWLVRVTALVGALICFVILVHNFYSSHKVCAWCRYLSCIDYKNWCDIGKLQLQNATNGTTAKRDFFEAFDITQYY